MSLWTKFRDTITGAAKVAIGTAIGGPIGGLIGSTLGKSRQRVPILTYPTPGVGSQQLFPAAAGQVIFRGLPPLIKAGVKILKKPAVAGGIGGAVGSVVANIFDEDGNIVGTRRRRRRMNPCNPKALRRAVRRLSMYHKQNKKIEAQLRKLAPRPARRRAPAHHHDHHH